MVHKPVPEECNGCNKVMEHGEELCCSAYLEPSIMWAYSRRCPLASHIEVEAKAAKKKKNPLKHTDRPAMPRKYTRTGKGRRKDYVEGV